MARFQCWRSVRRWKMHSNMTKQQSLLRQRAYFFLYYQLMKKSLRGLRKYTSVKRNDHKNMHLIGSARRNALLGFTMKRWSQQRLKRWILREWRAESTRKQCRSAIYDKTVERVSSKYHASLLHQLFLHWRQNFLGRKIHHAILNVLNKFQFKLLQLAWKQWNDQMARLIDSERLMQNRRIRLLQQSWKGWKIQTASKQKKENNRRRAVRFRYLSRLRNGFSAFHETVERQHHLLDLASKKRYELQKLSLVRSFTRWKSFTNTQMHDARKKWIAMHHYETGLIKRVWSNGFCCLLERKHAAAIQVDKMRMLSQERSQLVMFAHWKEFYVQEHDRTQFLEAKLVEIAHHKQLASKQRIFTFWAEYRHERFAKRIISAQVYGQWQLKLLQTVFTQWQTGVAAAKWHQILNERAKRHYATKLVKKAFSRWKIKTVQIQEYWQQTKCALIHWKLTQERKSFARWKIYAADKKLQRQRMHDAFNFRQDYFLREGLRHWITAATHLHQQREARLGHAQAMKTARIWRKVAAIARHWYHLTMKRRFQTPRNPLIKRVEATRLLPEALYDHENWLVKRRAQLHPPVSHSLKNQRVEHSNLSEFVMLPRTRPQPRRPIDLLLAGAEGTIAQHTESDALHSLRSKYGFQFPVEVPSAFQVSERPQQDQVEPDRDEYHVPVPPITPPFKSSMDCIDELEQQLLSWKTWKTDWKMFQAKIESARVELEQAMMNRYEPTISCHVDGTTEFAYFVLSCSRNVTKETIYALRSNVNALEKRDLNLHQQWLESKPKIRAIAKQIQHLRASITA